MEKNGHPALNRATLAGVLVSMGIVFGDIGTSPLYALSAIIGDRVIEHDLILGALSAVFWTLTFQTTLKYVLITLRADNKGEGGIFSLYALVRRFDKRLVFPAMIGGAFLLADGIITPPISVSSAIEGLQIYYPQLDTVPIVIVIIVFLFTLQQFGTSFVGKSFGPVMLLWFGFMGAIGLMALVQRPEVLKAVNPYYAIHMITHFPHGFWILGGVFLCTTGAEALYSDLGHCGRENIRVSWIYVKICLLLSYAGQCAWLLSLEGKHLGTIRPFYAIIPEPLLIFSIVLATVATVIASQALISGSYTLINEAMQLNLWLRTKVSFPSDVRGQIYVPRVNWSLMVGCIAVVLYFQRSTNMEAAYGLAVTITMIMTTVLVAVYLVQKKTNKILIVIALVLFLTIEGSFLIANAAKFTHGGWVSVLIGCFLAIMMYILYRARQIKRRLTTFVPLNQHLPTLVALSEDESVPKYATHLVYLTASSVENYVEQLAIDSIIRRSPKRADMYWFVNVNVTDEPYQMSYRVTTLAHKDVIYVRFNLGFRVEPRLNLFFRLVVEDMVRRGEVDISSRYHYAKNAGDFRFVIFKSFLSNDNELPAGEKLVMDMYLQLQKLASPAQEFFGLDTSNVTLENVPLLITPPPKLPLVREA